jgi:hypothetical protein
VETQGAKPVEQKILVGESNKEQTFFVHVAPEAAPARPVPRPEPTAARERPVPWPVYALGGLGITSFAFFGSFGTAGVIERGSLGSCRPTCSESDVDSVRTKYTVANVALGVGLLALGAATVLYLVRPEVRAR